VKVTELIQVEPKAQAYELKKDGRYLICFDKEFRHLTKDCINTLVETLYESLSKEGIKVVAVIDFVPRIFELEPEKE